MDGSAFVLRSPEWSSHLDAPSSPRATEPSLIGVDLFCGAGGFSLAAQRTGIRIVAAVENDANACKTYQRNFITGKQAPPYLFKKDIRTLEPDSLFIHVPELRSGCDVMLGGPPCQGFSTHRLKGKGIDDPRNELLIRYFDFVRMLRPKAFLVENVPGLLWPRHADYLERFLHLADITGYDVVGPKKLNARDYGVPQNRRRVFILGICRSFGEPIPWPPAETHRRAGHPGRTMDERPEWQTAADVFQDPLKEGDANAIHMNHSKKLVELFKKVPLNGGSRRDVEDVRILKCHEGHDGHSDVYGRIDPKRPGPTMTTACINPSKGRFVHPTEPHGITLRHAARFQTFPDDFVFEGGLMSGGVQVGNAVPVLMGECLLAPVAAAIRAGKVGGGVPWRPA